jgi:hypothetical protein
MELKSYTIKKCWLIGCYGDHLHFQGRVQNLLCGTIHEEKRFFLIVLDEIQFECIREINGEGGASMSPTVYSFMYGWIQVFKVIRLSFS